MIIMEGASYTYMLKNYRKLVLTGDYVQNDALTVR